MTITAADVVATDPTFCCPLIGLYPCERERQGCFCHELHLINTHDAQVRWRQFVADAKAERDCEPCEGRGYFDSRHLGYSGHTTCSWCNGTGRAHP